MSDQMHLLSFPEHLEGVHHALRASRADRPDERFKGRASIDYWQGVARTLERGKFDGIFFADSGAIYDRYKGRADEALKYGIGWPKHDPMPTLALMGAVTERLGFAFTQSIAAVFPYPAMRLISTLDFLTNGRVGWNIVTGNARMEYEAVGLGEMEHDARYDRADEYMEVCNALWRGIPHDAIIMDDRSGIVADPSRIGRVDFEGKYLKSRGVPLVAPSPQGRPVLFQAGSSGRGQQFALKHADVIFSIQGNTENMRRYVDALKVAAVAQGRKDPVRVIFGLQVVLGSSEAEAGRRREEMLSRYSLEASLTRLSGSLGIDFSTIDLDSPMEEWPTQASQGLVKALSSDMGGRKLTLREVAQSWATSIGTPHVVGTPEQVANEMEAMWRASGCHGFNVRPTVIPDSIEEFVDHVIPILQKRGVFRTDYRGETFRDNLLD
jgi:FMN-dependent oxidoreductase (nitrilotriacetate monooxygenase family)